VAGGIFAIGDRDEELGVARGGEKEGEKELERRKCEEGHVEGL
jgi:hypothetical protein